MFGFFSVFNSDALKNVTLYKGSFPARFGGRLSSVVDVRMKDGDDKKIKGTASVGAISSKIQLEGPIIKEKTTFNISARRTYIVNSVPSGLIASNSTRPSPFLYTLVSVYGPSYSSAVY